MKWGWGSCQSLLDVVLGKMDAGVKMDGKEVDCASGGIRKRI